jgi:hypothetical protein
MHSSRKFTLLPVDTGNCVATLKVDVIGSKAKSPGSAAQNFLPLIGPEKTATAVKTSQSSAEAHLRLSQMTMLEKLQRAQRMGETLRAEGKI